MTVAYNQRRNVVRDKWQPEKQFSTFYGPIDAITFLLYGKRNAYVSS